MSLLLLIVEIAMVTVPTAGVIVFAESRLRDRRHGLYAALLVPLVVFGSAWLVNGIMLPGSPMVTSTSPGSLLTSLLVQVVAGSALGLGFAWAMEYLLPAQPMPAVAARSRRRVQLAVIALLGLALLGGVAVIAYGAWRTIRRGAAQVAQLGKRLEADWPLLKREQRVLASDPFFHLQVGEEKDAAQFLNPRVPWSTGEVAPLSLPVDVVAVMSAWDMDGGDIPQGLHIGGLDFSWMAALSEFGKWDLLVGSPLEKMTHSQESFSLPDFKVLGYWARLRLIKGLRDGAPALAGREARQLAWLCYRSDVPIGEWTALEILRADREAHDLWQSLGHDVDGWEAMELQQIDRFQTVATATMPFVIAAAPPAVLREALDPQQNPVGRCGGLAMGALAFAAGRPMEEALLPDGYRLIDEELRSEAGRSKAERTSFDCSPLVAHLWGLSPADLPFIGGWPRMAQVAIGAALTSQVVDRYFPSLDDLEAAGGKPPR